MNSETRDKLSNMVETGLISQEDFLSFFRRRNVSLKDLLSSQYDLSENKIKKFKCKILDLCMIDDTALQSDEITVLSKLINSKGVLSRKEIIKGTKLSPRNVSDAITGLLELGFIDKIKYHNNEIYVFILNKKYMEITKNE